MRKQTFALSEVFYKVRRKEDQDAEVLDKLEKRKAYTDFSLVPEENMRTLGKLLRLARGGFKRHTSVGEGHMKDILKEAFTTYLHYDWVEIDG